MTDENPWLRGAAVQVLSEVHRLSGDPKASLELLIPIVLIVVGFALILVEVYLVPGFNVIGILGFLLIVFAVGYVYSESGVVGGSLALFGSAAAGVGLFYGLWKSGAWNKFILATSLRHDDELVAREHEHRARHLGKSGVAITPLRPTGEDD